MLTRRNLIFLSSSLFPSIILIILIFKNFEIEVIILAIGTLLFFISFSCIVLFILILLTFVVYGEEHNMQANTLVE